MHHKPPSHYLPLPYQTPPHKTTEDARATSPVIGNFLSPPCAHDSRLYLPTSYSLSLSDLSPRYAFLCKVSTAIESYYITDTIPFHYHLHIHPTS